MFRTIKTDEPTDTNGQKNKMNAKLILKLLVKKNY
jgi:hypothetical protein